MKRAKMDRERMTDNKHLSSHGEKEILTFTCLSCKDERGQDTYLLLLLLSG